MSGQKAWYESHITEVSVSYKVSEHAKKIARLYWIDVGFINVSMDEVRKAQQGIEQVTKGQVKDQGDGVELKHRELLSVFWSNVGKSNQGQEISNNCWNQLTMDNLYNIKLTKLTDNSNQD